MGWLQRAVNAVSNFPSDAQLRDFNYMSMTPIGHIYPTFGNLRNVTPDMITVTVVNRLCHLIRNMERLPNYWTAMIARWFEREFQLIPILPAYRAYVNELRERLTTLVDEFERDGGVYVNADRFGRVVGPSENEKRRILYGPPLSETFLYSPNSRDGYWLNRMISGYGWKSSYQN